MKVRPHQSRLRLTLLALLILLGLGGCAPGSTPDRGDGTMPTLVAEVLTAVATNQPTPVPAETAAPSPTALPPATSPPPATETPTPTETPAPPPTAVSSQTGGREDGNDLAILPNRVFIYPVPELFEGDQVTFQFVVRVPDGIDSRQVESQLLIDGQLVAEEKGLTGRNLGGDPTGLFQWAWNTSGRTGSYQVEIIIDPADRLQEGDENLENNRFATTLTVKPRSAMQTVDQNASWIVKETDYAIIHVVSGTAAARDLQQLAALADEAAEEAALRLAEEPRRKFDIYFVDRVIGQGGYAAGGIVISYLDRNYSGGSLRELLVHETIHLLDQQFVGDGRLPFLAEGVAVWAAGGHYKAEDLSARARALRDSGLYIPLNDLIDNFYPVQHEIGYLQAGAFIQYLVDQYGWPAVRSFYSDVRPAGYTSAAAAVDASLQANFGRTLTQIEQAWLLYLDSLPYDRTALVDVNSTIRLYEIMRRYQLAYDQTAYFRLAWLPSPAEMIQRGITADINRHPTGEINIILETMLTEAEHALRAGDYQQAEALMSSVDRVVTSGSFIDPLAQTYRDIIRQALEWGFEVHRLQLNGTQATALVTNPYTPNLLEVEFAMGRSGWTLLQ